MPPITIFIKHCISYPSKCGKARKKIKGRKGKNNAFCCSYIQLPSGKHKKIYT